MLPIILVLFVATSAFAAPTVTVSTVPIQETARPYDTGYGFNSGLAGQAIELVDEGDTNVYILTMQQCLKDLADQKDSRSQAIALSQVVALLGEIAYGIPGDSCAAASAINSYASGRGGRSYLSQIARSIDTIATLSANPASIRFASSPAGNCNAGGRVYSFEAAWDAILNSASPYNLPLINEEYCAAKRLYQALNVRSNNVAAAITAASLPDVVAAMEKAAVPVMNFLRASINGNGYSLAASAKAAVLSA